MTNPKAIRARVSKLFGETEPVSRPAFFPALSPARPAFAARARLAHLTAGRPAEAARARVALLVSGQSSLLTQKAA